MSTLTVEEVAKRLNGCEYREEEDNALFEQCKTAGIVVLFGASDDLAEFRGAIYDEIGCFDGGDLILTRKGVRGDDDGEKIPRGARIIEAVWCDEEIGSSWSYKTDIPHVTFDIMEDGELYCRGIVFRLADAKTEPTK